MGHLLKNAFTWKVRNFVCVFWPLVFPLILGTLFFFAFGNIGQSETMKAVPTALVMETENQETEYFEQFLEAVSQGDTPILELRKLSKEQAEAALAQKEVDGILWMKEEPSLTVAESGIQASILESVLRLYTDRASVIRNTLEQHPERLPQVVEAMQETESYHKKVSLGSTNLDYATQIFYALLGLASLYGGFMGLTSALRIQANISPLAARRCITPTHKLKLILAELISCFVLHMVNMLILLCLLRYVYRVPLGGSMGYTILICAFGVLVGVSFGFFVGAGLKCREGFKVGIVNGVSLLASACAGLMAPSVKLTIQRTFPLLNRLNPAAAITDSLYFIHIYNSPERMWQSLGILGGASAVLIFASFFVTRGERYASL